MHWYYESDGQPQGPIPDPQLRQLIAEHKISPYNRVWREGMEDWIPLRSLPELHTHSSAETVKSPASSPLPESPGEPGSSPAATPTPAPPSGSGGAETPAPETADEELLPAPEPPPAYSPAWESPSKTRGPLNFVRTAFEVLFLPGRAFGKLNHEGHWGPPLAYYLAGSIVGWLSFFETAFLLAAHDPNVPTKLLENFQQLPKFSFFNLLAPSFMLSGMLGPIALLGVACCLHGALAVTGSARRSLATTYRVAAYLMGTFALALCLLPSSVRIAVALHHPEKSGFWVSDVLLLLGVWAFVCTLRGAATAHRAKMGFVFLSLLILLGGAIILSFLILVRVAEMAALGA